VFEEEYMPQILFLVKKRIYTGLCWEKKFKSLSKKAKDIMFH
jgi:hypothetical protein